MYLILAIFVATLAGAAPPPVGKTVGMAIPIRKHSALINAASETINLDVLRSHVTSVKVRHHFQDEIYENITVVGKRKTTVPLTDFGIDTWYGPMSVGDPPQVFEVVFDTGSSNFFLPASKCDMSCDGHTRWVPTPSSHDLNREFEFTYLDGSSLSGDLYTDTVSVAGFTATDQIVAAATKYSKQLQSSKFPPDGVMGMSFRPDPKYHLTPVFQTLFAQRQVIDPVFSFLLSTSGGELYIGGQNAALYEGDFVFVPVLRQNHYWQVNMDNIIGNGHPILTGLTAIIDTGTSYIFGSIEQVHALHMFLGGDPVPSDVDGYYSFPCDAFPTISFSFNGVSFPISPLILNLGKVEADPSQCLSGILPDKLKDGIWLLGGVFLQNVYSTFDLGSSQVGFARLRRES